MFGKPAGRFDNFKLNDERQGEGGTLAFIAFIVA
jgi:hypothetical protein